MGVVTIRQKGLQGSVTGDWGFCVGAWEGTAHRILFNLVLPSLALVTALSARVLEGARYPDVGILPAETFLLWVKVALRASSLPTLFLFSLFGVVYTRLG